MKNITTIRLSHIRALLLSLPVAVLVIAGVVLRVDRYAVNRSLWTDEACLAVNIVDRSVLGFLQPLDWNQAAPFGFMVAVKAAITVLGNTEYALRLLPLLSSLAVLLIVAVAFRAHLKPIAVIVVLALLAFGEQAIYFASEIKQYSTDSLIAVLIVAVTLWIARQPLTAKRTIGFAVFGALCVWCSHPAVFVLAGAGALLIVESLIRRRWSAAVSYAGVAFSWALSFGTYYLISLRAPESSQYLREFWQGFFFPISPFQPETFLRFYGNLFRDPGGLRTETAVWVVVSLSGLGVLSLCVRNYRLAALTVLPIMAAFVASVLQRYPFGDRLMLFAMPLLFIWVGEGADRIARPLINTLARVRWVGRPLAGAALIGLVIAWMWVVSVPSLQALSTAPKFREELRPILEFVQRNRQAGDQFYIYYGSRPAFDYYALRYGFPPGSYIEGSMSRENPSRYLEEIAVLDGKPRVWLIVAHPYGGEDGMLLDYLSANGRLLAAHYDIGASATLFDMR